MREEEEEEEESREGRKVPVIKWLAYSPKLSLLMEASSDNGEEKEMVHRGRAGVGASASVPFLWEEEPGKPRPCTALINNSTALNANSNSSTSSSSRCLGLPPRLQQRDLSGVVTKTPSPTTVFEGPYVQAKSLFSSFSLRLINASKRHDSFDIKTPETTLLFLDPPQLHHHHHHHLQGRGIRRRGVFGSLGVKHKNAKAEGSEMELGSEDNFVFSPLFMDDASFSSKMRRNGSFSTLSLSKSRFLATMYKGFKHAIPWKGKK